MEVGRGLGNVSQAGHLEKHLLGLILGEVVPALVLLVWPRFDNAKFLVGDAAQQIACVAGNTTGGDKLLQAPLFDFRQGIVPAPEESVQRSWRDEQSLVSANGLADIVVCDGRIAFREGRLEQCLVSVNLVQFLHDCIGGRHGHFASSKNGALGLFLDGWRAAIPKLGHMHERVETGGGIASGKMTLKAQRELLAVHSVAYCVVAGVAGNGVVAAETFFVVERASKFDSGTFHSLLGHLGRFQRFTKNRQERLDGIIGSYGVVEKQKRAQ